MNFYYFNGSDHTQNGLIKLLERAGFTGALFTYDSSAGDYLTRIARDIDTSGTFKYMVAMRPYVISPQYLTMISWGMQQIASNRLQFNLISGHIKDIEKDIGGVLGAVNDQSNNIERSNYLIQYIGELNKMKESEAYPHHADFFVSATNSHVFNAAKKLKQKIIIPYREYKLGHWWEYDNYGGDGSMWPGESIDINNVTIMISVSPILRETYEELEEVKKKDWQVNDKDYFTYNEFTEFINDLATKDIEYLMLTPIPEWREFDFILDYVKNFTKENLKK